VALSAAALLAGGLAERVQAQDGRQTPGTLGAVGRYSQTDAQVVGADYSSAAVTGILDFFRDRDGVNLNAHRLITVVITPPGGSIHGDGQGGTIILDRLYVRDDGTFKKRFEDGSRISGKVETDFIASAFDNSLNRMTGTYRAADGTMVQFETDRYAAKRNNQNGNNPSALSYLMNFEAWRYTGQESGHQSYAVGDLDIEGHTSRGAGLGTASSANLHLYFDSPGDPETAQEEKRIRCRSGTCRTGKATAYEAGHFLMHGNADDARTIVVHQDIALTLDRSGDDGIASHLSFGAWMDNAGFFVATGGTFRIGKNDRAARMVVAVGEPTGSRPAATAVWQGSMVGTPKQGEYKNNLLRGEAYLRFDVNRSLLDARFFNIKDFTRFGVPYRTEELPKSRLRFSKIPVGENGSYARTYDDGVNIRGNFYGDSHAETAGTFDRAGIIAAFGAKERSTIAPPEEQITPGGEFIPEDQREVYEDDGRITINGEDTGRRWRD